MISALITSTRDSSTRRNIELLKATGRLVCATYEQQSYVYVIRVNTVKMASSLAIARGLFGISLDLASSRAVQIIRQRSSVQLIYLPSLLK